MAGTQSANGVIPGKLDYLHGLGLIIGLQIGSGIFSSPNQVHQHAGSYGASIIVWVCSGLLAWCGASCYAELGGAIPTNGGTQAYLKRMFNDYLACLYTWSAVTAMKPGSVGIIAVVMGEYISPNPIVKRTVAIAAIVVSVALNFWKLGASAGKFFLLLKVILILFVFVLGIVLTTKRGHAQDSLWGGTHSLGDMMVALYGGIWAYDGWDNLNFIAGEMNNPRRDLPRVISTAMPLVIIAYFAVNCAYFGALNAASLDAAPSVALTMARVTNSTVMVILVSAGIAGSCFGALNASMVSMVKLTQVSGHNNYLPSKLTEDIWASLLQVVFTAAYILVGEFKLLVTFYGATMYVFYCFSISGLLILRYREPDLDRPFRAWLIAPILFLILSVSLLVRTTIAHPFIMLFVFAFSFAGTPWYYYRKWYIREWENKDYGGEQGEDQAEEHLYELANKMDDTDSMDNRDNVDCIDHIEYR